MGLIRVHVGDRVESLHFGKGTVKAVSYGNSVSVEFDKFMDGHDCDRNCKYGYGWYCSVHNKHTCKENFRNDSYVFLVNDCEEWD